MPSTNVGSADVLMLEPPPPLVVATYAEIIDALPYIDDEYDNPIVKEEVDRLVEEEMRHSSKKPSDFRKKLLLSLNPSFRLENLELISKHGSEVWKLYNEQLEASVSRYISAHHMFDVPSTTERLSGIYVAFIC